MNAPTDQPSKISTEEEVRPADEHVVTDDREFFAVPSPAADDDKPAASGAKPADQTTEKPAASDDKKPDASQGGRDRPAERKIKRLQKQLAQEKQARQSDQLRIDDLAGEIDKLKGATAAAVPEPQFKDFDSPQEYAKAFQKWEAAQSSANVDSGKPKPVTRDTTKHAQPDTTGHTEPDPEIKDFHSKGKEKLGDEFMEALELEGTAVDQDMGEFMLDSDFGPEIYVHLANNQDEAQTIFDSSTRRKVAALEALEAKAKKGELDVGGDGELQVDTSKPDDKGKGTGKPAAAASGTDKVQTKAGDPPSDTREAGTANLESDPENESMDEYAARRGKEEMKRRGIYK